MIQRIQSLLLFGAILLLSANLVVPIWTSTEFGVTIRLDAFSITKSLNLLNIADIKNVDNSKNTYYIASLICICIGLASFCIFLFKNRPKQLMYCNLLTVLILMIIGCYFIAIPAAKSLAPKAVEGSYAIGYYLPMGAALLVLAARYFICKDDELVKSVDRIR